MLEQLLLHIQRHQLCKTTDKILLAVSGGVDSMVMLQLFQEAGFSVGVAHCNFQLRGDDSLADEALVRKICEHHNIPVFIERFETAVYAQHTGLSIQLAARNLRYDFFEGIRHKHGYDFIATAHHLNDSIETVILNLTKGTGVKGLVGIPVKNKFVIRPLLFASREMIMDYANAKSLAWREDSSNLEDDYQRNFLRHQVIPRLKEINPNLEQTFAKTIERISGAVKITEKFLDDFRSNSCKGDDERLSINTSDLMKLVLPQVILWELIKSKGFSYEQCVDALQVVQSGKMFFSTTHNLTIDRDLMILTKREQGMVPEVLIEYNQERVTNGFQVIDISKKNGRGEIVNDPSFATLDTSKMAFPLRWRKWKNGDSFIPLGMNTHKKISDLLIDLKIPNPDKEKITVLESGGEIVWVVGVRVSDGVKITSLTTASICLKATKLEAEKIS